MVGLRGRIPEEAPEFKGKPEMDRYAYRIRLISL